MPLLISLLVLVALSYPAGAQPAAPGGAAAWSSLPEALDEAAARDRPVLVYVRAPWCGPCRRMERDVFPEVTPLLERFARARLTFDDHDGRLAALGTVRSPAAWARHLGADVTPAVVLLEADGSVITRATGFLDARALGLLLAYAATGAYRHASFDAYARAAGP